MSPPPLTHFVLDPYSLLLKKLDHLAFVQSRFQEVYTIDASYFVIVERLNELHFSRIQHLGYDIPEYTEFMHPIPIIAPPFTA